MAKILLVEDDKEYARVVLDLLELNGHKCDWFETATDALLALRDFAFDVIILDWELPDRPGIAVCEEFRKAGGTTPILMLTGRMAVEEKEKGLDTGADDYLTKPANLRELAARVRALLRRCPQTSSNVLSAGTLELDTVCHIASRSGVEIKLQPIEFALLEFFLRNPTGVFSLEHLLDRVWTMDNEAQPHAVRACINRVRTKVDVDGEQSIIKTVHGVGYKLRD